MSMLTIAIIAGIILCLVVLIVQRRKDRDTSSAAGAGRGKSERKRRRGKKNGTPPPPPEPMPLAAAGQSSARTSEPGPAPEWSAAASQPSVAEWPPADDAEPIDWAAPAPAPAPAAAPQQEPAASQPEEPAPTSAEPQFPTAPPITEDEAGWPSDEIVTEPGWPIPGEVDVPWSAPSEEPVGAAAGGWSEQAATSAPPADLQWAPPEQVAAEIPQWTPSAEPAAEEIPQWTPPEEPVQQAAPAPEAPATAEEPVWETPAEDTDSGWVTDESYTEDGQATGQIPVTLDSEPEPEVPVAEAAHADSLEMEIAPFEEGEEIALEEFAGEPAEFPMEQPQTTFAPQEPEIAFAPQETETPFAPQEPEIAFAPQEPEIAFAPQELETALEWDDAPVEALDAPEPVAHAAVHAIAPVAVPVAAPEADDPARTGRFAIGGFALQPGQQALGGVSFRAELPQAPTAWTVTDSDDLAPGTLVLQLDGTINCDASGLEVVTDPGFAPTPLGFTVRVAALASGPFAASGTFRVR